MSNNISPFYVINCPWCDQVIQIMRSEINCRMFVCGLHKLNGQCVNPHISQHEAETLKSNGSCYGCLNPFYFDGTTDQPRQRQYG